MVSRVEMNGALLTWAKERSGIDAETLERRFPQFPAWESGETAPTLRQLEKFARATHMPVGYLFLPAPPDEPIPLPDFRTMSDVSIERLSADLLDTVYQCQQRQEWYRDFARISLDDPVALVGSLNRAQEVAEAAVTMRDALEFNVDERGRTWSEAFRRLADNAENIGILVMVNGVVGSNTHRKLNPREFRGFAMADPLAPLVFVNGADTKAAQIFTLAHELAHIWLGESALSNVDLATVPEAGIERWCNDVAAELLVPTTSLRDAFSGSRSLRARRSITCTFRRPSSPLRALKSLAAALLRLRFSPSEERT